MSNRKFSPSDSVPQRVQIGVPGRDHYLVVVIFSASHGVVETPAVQHRIGQGARGSVLGSVDVNWAILKRRKSTRNRIHAMLNHGDVYNRFVESIQVTRALNSYLVGGLEHF